MTVINLEDGNAFTTEAAWEFVAEKPEDPAQVVQWIELKKPPGKKALVMLVAYGKQEVYIKLQFGAGKIHGRSFHYSTY